MNGVYKAADQTGFFDRQVDYLVRKDIDGLVENQYSPDAVLMGLDMVVRGREALRSYYNLYIQRLGYLKVISINQINQAEDGLIFDATVETQLGVRNVYNAFVLRDGKAIYHFTGVK